MNEERLPRRIFEWSPHGKRRKGRPRNLWMREVTTEMREKGITSMEWIDTKEWVRFPVHSGWNSRDVSMAEVRDCVKECVSSLM